ncbi:helix-turn-helix domain-containing protein [Pseudomonas aeruginosa]|uniref:helix-turn-helix domain-containing protein n=1 Tax=Pseudomonas aeruginosa TaxID=287 RepID=UPI001F0B1E6B|nr:helix-turn-helix domain-containing protein [Pseudomonas aeruginosa]
MPDISLGDRLKAERERLGYTQTEFADLAGASKRSQIGWEQGRSAPDANALAAWLEEGLDVIFVLSGQRTNVATTRHLPPDEQLLLEVYQGMAATARKQLLAELLTGGKKPKAPSESAGIKVSGSGHRIAGRDYHEKE